MTHHTNLYLLAVFTLFCVIASIGLHLWINILEVMP
jgi:hypothetical protein